MTEEQPDTSARTIPAYSRGQWTTRPHPIPESDGDYDRAKRDAGWDQFTRINDENSSLYLEVWRNEAPGSGMRFLVEIGSVLAYDTVGAVDVADMMELVARWAPAVQAAVLADLYEAADFSYAAGTNIEFNRIANIGALAAEGAEQRQAWISRQLTRNMERRERARRERDGGDQ